MKHYLVSLKILLLVTLLYQCTNKDEDTVISISKVSSSDENLEDSVRISHAPVIDFKYLLRSKLDSLGKLTAKVEVSQPLLATLNIGNSYAKIFLRPGESLSITYDSAYGFDFRANSGKSALGHFNNHLNQTLEILNTNGLMGRSPDDFLTAIDSIEKKIKSHTAAFRDSIEFNSGDIQILDKLFKLNIEYAKIWYAFRYYNDALVEQVYAFREGRQIIEYESPKVLSELWDKVVFDTALLSSPIYSDIYKQMLWAYSEDKFSVFDVKLWNKPDTLNPFKTAAMIKDKMLPKPIAEYLYADNVNKNLWEHGVTKITDSLFRNFELEFPDSKYTPTLARVFEKQGTLTQGRIAPNIRGTKSDGTIANLTDFKGRIVYIDVWATWCGPCVEEIPHSIELQKYFKNDPNIIFLNVSVDRDIEAWRRKIEIEKSWGGVHVNLKRVQVDSLGFNYGITGYPTYILIDKDGKILTTRAQRPSSGEELKAELERLSKTNTSL
jgi:thiol-disulfide isomerase/thioredoxin